MYSEFFPFAVKVKYFINFLWGWKIECSCKILLYFACLTYTNQSVYKKDFFCMLFCVFFHLIFFICNRLNWIREKRVDNKFPINFHDRIVKFLCNCSVVIDFFGMLLKLIQFYGDIFGLVPFWTFRKFCSGRWLIV